MKTGRASLQTRIALLATIVVLSLAGCDQVAFDPIHGRLRGDWTVNEQAECEVPRGVPVIAKVQVRNVYRWRVRMPKNAIPWIEGAEAVVWKPLRPLPSSLAAGAVSEAWWLMEGEVPVGRHEIAFQPDASIPGIHGLVTVSDAPVPGPLLIEQRAAVARLSGTSKDLAAELLETPDGEFLPTTRLVLADLLREADDPDQAAVQLERFAEEIYGVEGLPNWLQLRMQSVTSKQ